MRELSRHYEPKYWFISDSHHGNHGVLKNCNRPFDDMDHQDRALTETWNRYVTPQDIVFILGDFSFYTPEKTSKILAALNGQKNLIKGNHDHSKDTSRVLGWNRVMSYHEQKFGDYRVVLSHFPFMSWHQQHRGAYHLHGHCHGRMQYPGELASTRILDVGVDHIFTLTGEYRPLEWSEIKEMLSGRRAGHSDDKRKVRP